MEKNGDRRMRLKGEVALLHIYYPSGSLSSRTISVVSLFSWLFRALGRPAERHASLHVRGYTARRQVKGDSITAALVEVVQRRWEAGPLLGQPA